MELFHTSQISLIVVSGFAPRLSYYNLLLMIYENLFYKMVTLMEQ